MEKCPNYFVRTVAEILGSIAIVNSNFLLAKYESRTREINIHIKGRFKFSFIKANFVRTTTFSIS